jgi:tetratricopeptide (TPR) repeat protein
MQWLQQKTTKSRNGSGGLLALAAVLVAGSIEAQPTDSPGSPEAAESAQLDDRDSTPELIALRRARDTLVGIRDFDAALRPAQEAVAAQEQQRDSGYALDLAALARIQGELRDIEGAETKFLEAIELISAAEGEYSVTLIDIYRGLGRAYIRGSQYPQAITTLEQAQHISQRNLGLFNVEQSPLLDDITTAYLGLGDTTEARRMQLDRLDNAVRRFGANDVRVIPYRYTLANYYERSRLPESAREQYEEVLKSQEATLGGAAADLLAPLRQLVRIDLLLAQGEIPERHDQLVALLEQNPTADPLERGLSEALLGDWATVTGDPLAARSYYQRAWVTLQQKAELDVPEYFAKPAMLDFVAPLNAVDRGDRRDPYAWAQVVLEFDVSAEGVPSDVRVIADGAPGPLQLRYARRLRETHFRPRLVGGEPVTTTNVRSTHYFRYYVDEDERQEANEGS